MTKKLTSETRRAQYVKHQTRYRNQRHVSIIWDWYVRKEQPLLRIRRGGLTL